MPNFDRSRQVWHNHIARWGGGVDAHALIRASVERPATIAMSTYSQKERERLAVDNVVRFMISALGVSEENVPDPESDRIKFSGKIYKIVLPPEGQQPDGTWIAFDTAAVFMENVVGES